MDSKICHFITVIKMKHIFCQHSPTVAPISEWQGLVGAVVIVSWLSFPQQREINLFFQRCITLLFTEMLLWRSTMLFTLNIHEQLLYFFCASHCGTAVILNFRFITPPVWLHCVLQTRLEKAGSGALLVICGIVYEVFICWFTKSDTQSCRLDCDVTLDVYHVWG